MLSTQLFKLISDISWVALFAYIVNRAAAYSMRRLEVYGKRGDLFPPAEILEYKD